MVEEGLNIVFWTLKDRFLSKKKNNVVRFALEPAGMLQPCQ